MRTTNPNRPVILTLLSPRREFTYRFHDALLALPGVEEHYSLYSLPYCPFDGPVPDFSKIAPNGIITSTATDVYDCSAIVENCASIVNLSSAISEGMMSLSVSGQSLAETVVDHALGAGFKKVVCVYSDIMFAGLGSQLKAFDQAAQEANLSFDAVGVAERQFEMSISDWEVQHSSFIERMKKEEHRTLYYTFIDSSAVLLNQVASRNGLLVPEELGILGYGDSLKAKLSDPPLSSISPLMSKMALMALGMLGESWKGKGVSQFIDAGVVKIRESTMVKSVHGDATMLKIAALIRNEAFTKLKVDDLAQAARISRSSLEKRYRVLFDESPAATICRVRMERACELLERTHYTIDAVAHSVGYASPRAFFRAFELHYHMTPGKWRTKSGAT